ncbi:MAG: sigma-54 dependent DNA-binding response regulator [Fibrobacteria bacterium]|jgi:two-component system response regulator HydG|nr:sigma-54 dependent DNA-binding response regulator [Fibrobacteria bacterium]
MKKKLLILDDEQSILDSLSRALADLGHELILCTDPHKALEIIKVDVPQVVITDLKMPGMDGLEVLQRVKEYNPDIQVILITGHGSIDEAVMAMKKGAYDFIPKPFNKQEIASVVHRAFDKVSLLEENFILREKLKKAAPPFETGKNRAFRELLNRSAQAANSDATILILGESGTGKEVLANYIFQNSGRALKPFVTVNCAAIPENLIEAELFGYKKGAFTGAYQDKKGKFVEADGGTMFLDEIGEMPLAIQAKLLRVLQEGEITPVGGAAVKVDVRIIAATNKVLRKMVEENKFREDLFYRLNVIPLNVPPLRQRPEDLHALLLFFIAKYCKKNKRPNLSVSAEALRLMEHYSWPGNVRELENAIERAVILCLGHQITVEDLPPELSGAAGQEPDLHLNPGMTLAEIEMSIIRSTLERNHGDKAKTAEDLGISLRTIYRKLDALEEELKSA